MLQQLCLLNRLLSWTHLPWSFLPLFSFLLSSFFHNLMPTSPPETQNSLSARIQTRLNRPSESSPTQTGHSKLEAFHFEEVGYQARISRCLETNPPRKARRPRFVTQFPRSDRNRFLRGRTKATGSLSQKKMVDYSLSSWVSLDNLIGANVTTNTELFRYEYPGRQYRYLAAEMLYRCCSLFPSWGEVPGNLQIARGWSEPKCSIVHAKGMFLASSITGVSANDNCIEPNPSQLPSTWQQTVRHPALNPTVIVNGPSGRVDLALSGNTRRQG